MSATRVIYRSKTDLPPDINQTLGGLNLFLLDGFSKVRAVSFEFFRRSFSVPRNIFKEVDPLAEKLTKEMKEKEYRRAKNFFFANRSSKEGSSKKVSEADLQRTLGRFNLKVIETISSSRAFGRVFFSRVKKAFEGFSTGVDETSAAFSLDTKMKLYYRAKKKPEFFSQRKDIPKPVRSRPPFKRTTKVEVRYASETAANSKYNRTTLVVAFLGIALILAFLVYPFFHVEEKQPLFEGMETVSWKERMFFVHEYIPRCLERTFTCPIENNVIQGLKTGGCAVSKKFVSLSMCPDRCLTIKPYSDYVIQV